MIKTIYLRAITVLSRKPVKLWALSLLCGLLSVIANVSFGLMPVVAVALCWLLSTGMTMIYLHGYLGEEVEVENLFDCFRDWKTVKRVLGGTGYAALWVFLWGLIPVVGFVFAIIRGYEYALTPYIIMMEPEISAKDACEVSKKRMLGFKGKLFLANFLWTVIAGVGMLILFLLSCIDYVGIPFAFALFVVSTAVSLFGPLFAGLIKAAFYVEIQRCTGEGPQFDDSMNNPRPRYRPQLNSAPNASGAPSGDILYCSNCGTPNNRGSRFCCGCGNPLQAPPKEDGFEDAVIGDDTTIR